MKFEIDDSQLIEFAQSLARTPSQSGEEGAAVALVTERFSGLGFDEVEVDGAGNAIGILGSGDGPRLLIDGHIDTIPLHSRDSWTVDPFAGDIIDGKLYGLGICDQKASIAAAAHGLAAALRRCGSFTGTVALVGSVCEEAIEGAALAPFVERFRPDFAVTSEPSDTRLCIGQRGRAKVELRIKGRACHAGHAAEGLNAAEALALVIAEVRSADHPVHDRLGTRDITCIDIASWPYPSVSTVPGEAMARFDCRFLPGETPDSLIGMIADCAGRALADWDESPAVTVGLVQAEFATWTGAEFSLAEFEPAWWTEEESPLARAAIAGLTAVGIDPTPTHYSFCTNGSYLAGEAGIPTIGFGVGLENMAHQVDEHVTLDSIRRGAQGYAALATQLLAGAEYR
jgi:putative selenium metabolism hydrolase